MYLDNITQILTGLSAGVFFSWSVTVLPGTKVISSTSYLETMKRINQKILNPIFFIVFFSPAPLLAYRALDLGLLNLLAATFYIVGTLCVTMFKNVPLNNRLEELDLESLGPEQKDVFRKEYENNWNFWHYIRTVSSLLAFIFVIL